MTDKIEADERASVAAGHWDDPEVLRAEVAPVSYVGPMSEDDYLAVVERIQQAMAIEPFRPPLIDVVKLLSDWRDLSNQNERLRARLCYVNPDGSHVRGCAQHEAQHPAQWCESLAR